MSSKKDIHYKISTLSREGLEIFLNEISDSYDPPLKDVVNLREYAEKISTYGETFEAWYEDRLIGFVGGYFNNIEEEMAFITLVYIAFDWRKNHIGTVLMNNAMEYAVNKNLKKMFLEVKTHNISAQKFYQKLGFYIIDQRLDTYTMKVELPDNKQG